MRLMKKLAVLPAAILFLSGCNAPPDSSEAVSIDIELELEVGKDIGQPVGTLFTIEDGAGNVVMGAGFPEVYSTSNRVNHRNLNVFIETDRDGTFEVLSRPFPDTTKLRLLNIDGDLIAIDLQTLPDFAMKKLEADGSWSDYSTTIPTDYVIPLNNKELEIGLQDIVYDGNSILDNPEGFTIVVYYINGRMHIYSRDEQALYICDWEYDDPAPIDLDACEKHEMNYEDNQFPYSFGYYEGQLLFNLNRGDRYRYKDGVIRQLHDDKGWGAQIYAMLNGQGLIYAGHFPSGEVRIYDGGVDYREMTPNISVPTGLPKTWREVQTLQLYAGYMYAGVWPYAELHQYSFNDDSWELVQRVFSHPRYPRICGVEPYSCRLYPLYSATGDYNIFGERINEMELVDEYLYIARSNKDGAAYDESWGFLTEEKLAEYGSVVRYKKDYNLACQFNWPDDGDTTIRVTLDDSGLTVYQDSVELCSLSVDLEGIGIDDSTLKLGDGIFGAYGGDGLTLVD